jgi:hypothetical protein
VSGTTGFTCLEPTPFRDDLVWLHPSALLQIADLEISGDIWRWDGDFDVSEIGEFLWKLRPSSAGTFSF